MNNIAVGINLLFTGIFMVFLVLLFLMYIMKAISWFLGERPVANGGQSLPQPVTGELATDELVAVMTALGQVLPPGHQGVVRVNAAHNGSAEEDDMAIAAMAGALAVAMNRGK